MTFPWGEVGEEAVKRQSSGEPRPGVLDLGVNGRQHPTPHSSVALTHKMPVERDSLPPLVSLKTLPDMVLFPIGSSRSSSGPLWAVTSHTSFQILPAGVYPSPVPHCPLHLFLSIADLILSPACPMKPFFLALQPSTTPFLKLWWLKGEGAAQRKGAGRRRENLV